MTVQTLGPAGYPMTSGAFRVVQEEILDLRDELTQLKQVAQLGALPSAQPGASGVSIVVFSADLDRLLAAMNIATAAAAMGEEVHLFFTFWATATLRKPDVTRKRPFIERLFGWALPSRKALKLSKMHMGGLGTAMMKKRMKDKNIESLDDLFAMAQEAGVMLSVCEMSMDLLGMASEDLVHYPGLNECGAVTFLARAMESRVTLFI